MNFPEKKKETAQENLFARGGSPEHRFVIAKDSREQTGWVFEGDYEVVNKKLETGDYTLAVTYVGIKGVRMIENLFTVERKGSPSEMVSMVGQERERWTKELDRLARIPNAFVICEFTLEQFLEEAKLSGVNPASAFGSITSWQFKVPIIFAGNRRLAEETFLCLARGIWKKFFLGRKSRKGKEA